MILSWPFEIHKVKTVNLKLETKKFKTSNNKKSNIFFKIILMSKTLIYIHVLSWSYEGKIRYAYKLNL